MIIKYLFSLLYFVGILLIGTIFITVLHYFSILPVNLINILKIIISIIAIFISSFILGRKSIKLGYLEGIKFGSIIIILLVILNLIINSLSFKSILFFAILMIGAILGSMIGISFNKNN